MKIDKHLTLELKSLPPRAKELSPSEINNVFGGCRGDRDACNFDKDCCDGYSCQSSDFSPHADVCRK